MKKFSTICPHSPDCPSCSIGDLAHPPQYQEAKNFFSPLPFPLHLDLLTHYRYRVKLAVRGTREKPVFGLFRPATHELVDASRCIAHKESIEEGLNQIKDLWQLQPLEPYQENGQGQIRYLQITVQRETEKLQLVLVITQRSKEVYSFIQKLSQSPLWHSVWINIQPGVTNTIFGKDWERVTGEEFLWQKIGNREFAFHPASFSQVHLPLFEKMLEDLKLLIPEGAHLVELYSGMGVIGLSLAEKCSQVSLVEKNPYSLMSYQETMKRFPLEIRNKTHFLPEDVKDFSFLSKADTIVVDPPRKGLDRNLMKILCSLANVKLLYVSCNFETFARDAEELKRNGYVLENGDGYLFFPGTNHIEILAVLNKKSG